MFEFPKLPSFTKSESKESKSDSETDSDSESKDESESKDDSESGDSFQQEICSWCGALFDDFADEFQDCPECGGSAL